jgi:hypothetical protein
MKVVKNIAVNLIFLTSLFIVAIPPGMSEGQLGHGTFAMIVFLSSAMLTIVAPLAYGIRRFAVVVRTVGGVFVAWFLYLAVLFLVDRKPPILDDIIKYWFGAILSMTLIVLQFLYNKHNFLLLLGMRRDFGGKTTPPVILD